MNKTEALTTARWHCLNAPMPWSQEVNAEMIALLSDKLGFPAPGKAFLSAPIAPLPPVKSDFIIALCRGHGRPIDEGNVGYGGVSEEDYNEVLMEMVAARLSKMNIPCITVMDYPPNGYGEAMTWLAKHLKSAAVTAAIEFHFNAFDKTKSGHEVLHWENSKRGVKLAKCLDKKFTARLPNEARGLKPKSSEDRGALFLSRTHCPAALIEPFFGDNRADWEFFSSDKGMHLLADVIAGGIEDFKNQLEGAVV